MVFGILSPELYHCIPGLRSGDALLHFGGERNENVWNEKNRFLLNICVRIVEQRLAEVLIRGDLNLASVQKEKVINLIDG